MSIHRLRFVSGELKGGFHYTNTPTDRRTPSFPRDYIHMYDGFLCWLGTHATLTSDPESDSAPQVSNDKYIRKVDFKRCHFRQMPGPRSDSGAVIEIVMTMIAILGIAALHVHYDSVLSLGTFLV
jgi:hypothetical protein